MHRRARRCLRAHSFASRESYAIRAADRTGILRSVHAGATRLGAEQQQTRRSDLSNGDTGCRRRSGRRIRGAFRAQPMAAAMARRYLRLPSFSFDRARSAGRRVGFSRCHHWRPGRKRGHPASGRCAAAACRHRTLPAGVQRQSARGGRVPGGTTMGHQARQADPGRTRRNGVAAVSPSDPVLGERGPVIEQWLGMA